MKSKVTAAPSRYSMLRQKKLPKSDMKPPRNVAILSLTTTLPTDTMNLFAEQNDAPITHNRIFDIAKKPVSTIALNPRKCGRLFQAVEKHKYQKSNHCSHPFVSNHQFLVNSKYFSYFN